MSGDIEGAICDNCGSRIGPYGCCRTAIGRNSEIETLRARVRELENKYEIEPQTCNSGHTSHPMRLWDCPVCTDILRGQIGELLDALEAMTREWTWTEERSHLTSACKIECAKQALRVLARHGRFTVERIPGVPEKPEDDVRGWWPENLPERPGDGR